MTNLTLDQAAAIIEAAFDKGREDGLAPLTVAVLDAGGHPVALMRQDASGILRAEIATGKAYGALGFGLGSRDLHDKNPKFLAAVAAASGGKMVPVPGGVLAIDPDTGDIIGAVGISGDRGENDEACAVAGLEAAGLKAEPGVG
ncbi:MAG TPA: heme-binding protein [Rhodospirillales bacterium]|nr:heme-binding protein [Rhodospirillales bacterium]